MKDLIIQALNDALPILESRTPQTKKETKYVNIEDVKPLDIIKFMKDNDIPEDADFGGKPNSYDAFDEVCLVYDIDILTTEKDKLKYKRRVFSDIVFEIVYNLLTKNGYKRIGYSSTSSFKQFDDTTVYDMYINKDYDKLVLYYSRCFVIE